MPIGTAHDLSPGVAGARAALDSGRSRCWLALSLTDGRPTLPCCLSDGACAPKTGAPMTAGGVLYEIIGFIAENSAGLSPLLVARTENKKHGGEDVQDHRWLPVWRDPI
jgi:hypothetical protein